MKDEINDVNIYINTLLFTMFIIKLIVELPP